MDERRVLTEGIVDANGPRHSLLTLDGWEDLGGVLEGDWSFTERVANREEVHEPIPRKGSVATLTADIRLDIQDNWSDLGRTVLRLIQQRKPSGQQEDTHEREGLKGNRQFYLYAKLGVTHNQSQCPSTLGVDEAQCRQCRHHLNGPIAQRSVQGLGGRVADLRENGGAVERDDWIRVSHESSVRTQTTYC